MKEITGPQNLALPRGTLNPAAVGFTRRPLHLTSLPAGPRHGWRTKRWEYWGVMTGDLVLGMTIAGLDYAAVLQLYVYERSTGREISVDPLKLLPSGTDLRLPDSLPPLEARAAAGGLRLGFRDDDGGTRLIAESDRVQVQLYAPAGGDSLGVVVPWSRTRFQYTLKDVARAVSGTVTVEGRRYDVGPGAFAVLDRGRGRWPYAKRWNWGVGFGEVDGTQLGLQIGGGWTAGTGSTENALIVDGRLHHYDGELDFSYDLSAPLSPWHVRGPWLDAVLTPFHRRHARTNALVVASQTWQAFGSWSGRARTPDGAWHRLEGLQGWIEEARNRW